MTSAFDNEYFSKISTFLRHFLKIVCRISYYIESTIVLIGIIEINEGKIAL